MTKNIQYKKKEYPISVSYYCLKKTREELGLEEKDFNSAVTKSDANSPGIEMYETLLYYALIAGHEEEDKEMTLPREKMEFVLDACFKDFLKMVEEFYPSQEVVDAEKKPEPVGNRQQRRAVEKQK